MKIIILGSNGMLGSACLEYFNNQNIDAITFDKRFSIEKYAEYKKELELLEPNMVINCIGKIPQKNSTLRDYYESNIVLPKLLSELKNDIILIHASTDCVFKPNNSSNSMSGNSTTALDDYGMSKGIGDNLIASHRNGYVLRTSIIGFTKNFQSEGLLDWFARNAGKTVQGYDDHIWNGITTKSWAKFVYDYFISTTNYKELNNITHLGTTSVTSKYDLLNLVNEIKKFNVNIERTSSTYCDRSLVVDVTLGNIEQQIRELVND
ncbi:TPA: sugar nucleotide-binding protein [Vibrio vulnificus]|uniref:sugar nucleotide-binding protein n=1 Tax=Vibrio vulnificus TaxID=672 RepID=UPI0009B70335|nr:sugar nucleotide-binding protein [Vibrio vulnificus]EGQ8093354.1 sugar nucleotide-binding protein [Vibrio vulnificus]EHH0747220.1 sugar nucleotide-binding protein [Vibrio vulnificus]OQK47716.1 hypothetical protein XM74_c10255 [Vibrio vulnificus]POC25993.1 hypothetical protein CRN46_05200 [Vibrio vulnificus]HDY7433885.1 sugar nucleotide-binding protein [Vibrio vulnificus]